MVRIYSEAEKEKYVRGFKSCTLTLDEYANKMQIDSEKLKEWLKNTKYSEKFGLLTFDMQSNIENASSSKNLTFITNNIRIELKSGYDKALLRNIMEVILK